jgi:predicted MFS family arabinose efflux permease
VSAAPRALRSKALAFVVLMGGVSLFADFAYEGARSVTGPFLGMLGASGAVVSIVAGLGEFLGYGLRLPAGFLSERTRQFWPMTIAGYVVQLTAVPLLAIAPSWQAAAVLIVLERSGKAFRNPPRDVMLSHAAESMGLGWAFGLHEALDQCGALAGPLVVALVLALRHDYRPAFAALAIPAVAAIALVIVARVQYPRPEDLRGKKPLDVQGAGLPRVYWIYLAAAVLVSAGFADFSLIAFHAVRTQAISSTWIPVLYALAMAVSGIGSLVFGRLFDRYGLAVLVPLTPLAALSAPLVFFGGFWSIVIGCALWGASMGVHDSIVPAAVAKMVPVNRRPSAYGIFTGTYGLAWFLGSIAIGLLYTHSLAGVVAFCVAAQLLAIPIIVWLASGRATGPRTPSRAARAPA